MGGGISREALREHIPLSLCPGSYHCAMIGLDSAGKTTVLYRLKFKHYVNTAPTIGFNTEKVRLNGSTFTVWDVGGQDKLRPLWRSYTRCTDGIIFVVDSTTRAERLEEAKVELQRLCKSTLGGQQGGGGPAGSKNAIPILVLANKQDLPAALETNELEAKLGLRDLGNGRQWHLQPTCAVTGDGLQEGMERLREMIQRRRRLSRIGGGGGGGGGFLPVKLPGTSAARTPTRNKVRRSHSYHH